MATKKKKSTSKKASDGRTVPVYDQLLGSRYTGEKKGKFRTNATPDTKGARQVNVVRERISQSAANELSKKTGGKGGYVTGVYMDSYGVGKSKVVVAPKTVKTKKGTMSGKAKKK